MNNFREKIEEATPSHQDPKIGRNLDIKILLRMRILKLLPWIWMRIQTKIGEDR